MLVTTCIVGLRTSLLLICFLLFRFLFHALNQKIFSWDLITTTQGAMLVYRLTMIYCLMRLRSNFLCIYISLFVRLSFHIFQQWHFFNRFFSNYSRQAFSSLFFHYVIQFFVLFMKPFPNFFFRITHGKMQFHWLLSLYASHNENYYFT